MRIPRRFSGRVLTAAVIPIFAFGCTGRPTETPVLDSKVTVSAGSPGLVTSHISDFRELRITYSRAASGDTTEHESFRTVVEEHPLETEGVRTVLLTSSGHYSGGDYTDSLVIRRDDLAPMWERLRYPQRKIAKEIEFSGDRLRQVNRVGDSTRTFEMRFALPVFAFGEVDLLVRSLPLAPGYHAILPLYSEGDDSLEMDTVAVTGMTGHQWKVRFGDPAIVLTYEIDSASRRITQYDVVGRRTGGRARRAMETLH